jgi:hypothetical protein
MVSDRKGRLGKDERLQARWFAVAVQGSFLQLTDGRPVAQIGFAVLLQPKMRKD